MLILIYFANFWSSTILYSSIKRLAGGQFKEPEFWLVVVMASESLLFLKIRRMMLLIVFIALLILWSFSKFSSHSWNITTLYFFGPFFPFLAAPSLPRKFFFNSSGSLPLVVELIVVDVAGFVLREPLDSPGWTTLFYEAPRFTLLETLSWRLLILIYYEVGDSFSCNSIPLAIWIVLR